MLHMLLSDLDQHLQLAPGLPERLGLREEEPAGRGGLEAECEAGVRELGLGGEEEL